MPITIRTRLILGYSVMVLLLLVEASVGIYSRHLLLERIKETGEVAREIEETQRLSLAVEKALMPPNDYLISGDAAERDKFHLALKEVDEELKRFRGREILMDVEKTHLNDLEGKVSAIIKKAEEIFSLPPGRRTEGTELMYTMDGIGRDVHAIMDEYAEIDRQELKEAMEKGRRVAVVVDRYLIAGAALSILLAIAFVIYMERSIRIPIKNLTESVMGINGSHWEKVEIRDGAEITLLANEYNKMTERLRSAYEGLEEKVKERTAELTELNRRLEVLSITDGLTWVYNHRHFYTRLDEEMKRAERYGHSLSLIISDIDHFKHYNDTHGHPAGDAILKGVASCIKGNERGQDLVARYGGEEFSIILPETGKDAAMMLAERIRIRVSEQLFPGKETQPGGNLTISLGVATFPDDAADVKGLVNMADSALYRAKEGGRNRVEAVSDGEIQVANGS